MARIITPERRLMEAAAPALKIGLLPENAGSGDVKRWQENVRGRLEEVCGGNASSALLDFLDGTVPLPGELQEELGGMGVQDAVALGEALTAWYEAYKKRLLKDDRKKLRDTMPQTLACTFTEAGLAIPKQRHPNLERLFGPAFVHDFSNAFSDSRELVNIVNIVRRCYGRIGQKSLEDPVDLTPVQMGDPQIIALAVREALPLLRRRGVFVDDKTAQSLRAYAKNAVAGGTGALIDEVQRMIDQGKGPEKIAPEGRSVRRVDLNHRRVNGWVKGKTRQE